MPKRVAEDIVEGLELGGELDRELLVDPPIGLGRRGVSPRPTASCAPVDGESGHST